jgi:hypothetical protein
MIRLALEIADSTIGTAARTAAIVATALIRATPLMRDCARLGWDSSRSGQQPRIGANHES